MNKKALTAMVTTMLLFSVLIGIQSINHAEAETFGPVAIRTSHSSNNVEILFPENETYNTNQLLVDFTIEMGGTCFDFGYSLDGGVVEKVENITQTSQSGWIPFVTRYFRGSVSLSSLSDGPHSITIYQGSQYRGFNERYVVYGYDYSNFTIDTVAPRISLLSPETLVYNVSDLSLNFTVDEPISKVKYSLDGQNNVTIAGNATLANLSYGEHNVTVYATDDVGNMGSKTINFAIAEPPEPFPTTLVVTASLLSVAIAGIGLLVYFKKRKH